MRCLGFRGSRLLAGLGTGLLTTLLFCLPPLLDVRGVRPVLVLRRLVEQGPGGIARMVRALVGAAAADWAFLSLVVAALGGIAWALSDSAKVGGWFALSVCGRADCAAGAGGGCAVCAARCC